MIWLRAENSQVLVNCHLRFNIGIPPPAVQHNCPTLVVGGVADHVHALFALSNNHSIAEIVYEVKRGSSKWIKTKDPEFKKFHWQSGYGAFSVSQSHVEQVRRYIEGQERHHRRITFEDEFREFLRRYEVEFDERYLWD